jgi:hypothetical protein
MHDRTMMQVNIGTPWSIFTPTVFRMMERQYVDRFFSTGELLVSSFRRFSGHAKEAMRDSEGKHVVAAAPHQRFSQ